MKFITGGPLNSQQGRTVRKSTHGLERRLTLATVMLSPGGAFFSTDYEIQLGY